MNRSALARHTRLKQRRVEPRRTRHPLPLPTGKPITEAEILGEAFATGPQSKLCNRTKCAACFAVDYWRRCGGRWAIDWSLLPTFDEGDERFSHAHHEPHRSTRADAHDEDTYPLCPRHHYEGVGDVVRHRVGFTDQQNAARFYALLPFDWTAVRDEMRRRTALQATQGATP